MDEKNYLNIVSGAALPFIQAFLTGFWYALVCLGLAATANHVKVITVPAWIIAVTGFGLAGLWKWNRFMNDFRVLLFGVEPEQIAEPVADPEPEIIEPIRVELSSNNGHTMQFFDLPATRDQLEPLASGLVEGVGFTESQWVGGGAPFSRREFVRLRDEMIRRGLAQWNSNHDTARGVRVTSKGMAVFRHVIRLSPTLQKRVPR